MPSDHLRNAIKHQGELLQKRAEWLAKMIERQTQTVLNSQESIRELTRNLEATNLAIDSLRDEYRKLNGS